MQEVSGKAFDSGLLSRLYSFTKPYRRKFYLAVFLTVLIAFLSPLRPLLTQYTLDNHVANSDLYHLQIFTALLFFTLILQSVLQYFHALTTNLIGQMVIRDMRVKLFGRLINFRLAYFDKTPVGTTVTRSVSDMETVADIFSEGLIVIIGDLLQLVVIISVMLFVDWRLALISLSTIPLLMVATNIFKNKIKAVFGDVRTQVARLNTFVQEHLTGMKIIQIFNRQKEEYKRFVAINKEHRNANIRSVWYYSIFFPVVEILSAISIGLIVWWGAGGVIKEQVTLGSLIAFIMYINLLFRPIRELADKFNTLQMGMVSSERIFRVMDEDQLQDDSGQLFPEVIKGRIEFRDVWFAYDYLEGKNPHPHYVLKGISFILEPGQSTAFVGSTGAGKTTIISLLNRFYEISKGEILIDGIDIRKLPIRKLRSVIAVVLQDVFLFSDSIGNNISLMNPAVTEEIILTAARKVGAFNFIARLPGGLNFNVQERGSMLSMGQRQLISFIRAYVYNPAILILDEATSSVDSETEEMISTATRSLTEGRTSIIIAHRLSTIQNADLIHVLEQGRIIESGTHAELVQSDGLYKKLYEIASIKV